jgi:hypothetical protein
MQFIVEDLEGAAKRTLALGSHSLLFCSIVFNN